MKNNSFFLAHKIIRYSSILITILATFPAALIFLTPAAIWANDNTTPAPTQNTLTVRLSGFEHNRGMAVVSLYRKGDKLRGGSSFRRLKAQIVNGTATITFLDLAYKPYAIMAFHDENANDDLGHNFLGIPKEPMGFSNGFRPGIFSGMPTFKKLRFIFDARNTVVVITIK